MIVNVKFYSVEAGPELLKRGGKRGLALQTHTVGKMIFSPYRHVGSRFLPSFRRAFKYSTIQKLHFFFVQVILMRQMANYQRCFK